MRPLSTGVVPLTRRRVQTSDDFTRLAKMYTNVSLPTNPAQSSVQAGTIACPAENSTFLASSTLPPTPDESVCNCINENSFSCRVLQSTADEPAIVGSLTE